MAKNGNDNTKAVSIHTPTKGVTLAFTDTDGAIQVSIHTPTKGVTPLLSALILHRADVSIHTPTKGVTFGTRHRVGEWSGFNPHTHEGCDPRCVSIGRFLN